MLTTTMNMVSGVIIAREGSTYYVLTSKHVVEYLDYEYTVLAPDADSYLLNNSTINHIDGIDLAVISFESDRNYKVALTETSAARITPGMPVYVNGFPLAGQEIQDGAQFTSGSLTGINDQHRSGYNLVYSNFTREGMSGGPVLNSQGKLIGIHGLAEAEVVKNECETSATAESSQLPPAIGSIGSEANHSCDSDSKATSEKIDLNLGISIVTFIEHAGSIGMNQVLDTTAVDRPTRTPRISPASDTGAGCSGVICP